MPHTPQIWGPCLIFSQVIGALPWVVNSASVATPAPAQSLQVQAVTPQLLLNAQGQVIATLASSPLPQPMAVRKPNTPESPAKSEVPGLGVWMVTGRQYCVAWLLPTETSGRTRRFSKIRSPLPAPAEGLREFTHTLPRETAPILWPLHTCVCAHRGQRGREMTEQSRLGADHPLGSKLLEKPWVVNSAPPHTGHFDSSWFPF